MKKLIYILPIVALMFATSCEAEIPTWSGEENIRFTLSAVSDTTKIYSFLMQPINVTQDTIFIEVSTEGALFDFPRTVTIRQTLTGENDAVPGVHYVAFDDPQASVHYVIPARAHTA
jgi:hypothetical protein